MRQPYRLAVDMGTNSLGWSVFDLKPTGEVDERGRKRYQPIGIRRLGVRIFPDGRDPQSGASLAAARREPRAARRRRDRYLDRRKDLMEALIRHGLMPTEAARRKALECLDPYELRAAALDRSLPPHHLGRALFHLNQRRGFKSNRKTDKAADEKAEKEAEGLKRGIKLLWDKIDGTEHRTLGEYLWKTARAGRKPYDASPVRARARTVKNRNEYDAYPDRRMYEAEFDLIWQRQMQFDPALSATARDEIRDIVFWQRPLKPVDPGPCTFHPEEPRAPLALPLQQEFRMLQELANLKLESALDQRQQRPLTLEERDTLLERLKRKDKLTWTQIRRSLGIGAEWQFNLEDERRSELKGDALGAALSKEKCFGARWWDEFDDARRAAIVACLLDEQDEERLLAEATWEWGVDAQHAHAIAAVRVPDGYGRLGRTALAKIVKEMRKGADPSLPPERNSPIVYSDAAQRAGYHHSDFRDGVVFDALPYYGEVLSRYTAPVTAKGASEDERTHGRIANPTVHVGLNQLRKLINALVQRYGRPAEIVVELARELKMNAEQRERLKKEQRDNKAANDRRRADLAEIERTHGLRLNTADAMLRMRLWEELGESALDRKCVYTGRQISARMVFDGSTDIDHILPFKRSLDDSPANLTLVLRRANRFKRNDTPHDAFSNNPLDTDGSPYEWDGIWARSQDLPRNKRWRFRQDALDIVKDKARRALLRERNELPGDVLHEIEDGAEFIARQLVDTAYLARVTRLYLAGICDNGPDRVRVVPGGLTGLLRRMWGLNKLLYGNRPEPEADIGAGPQALAKRRDDHRHHALDAVVIGVTSAAVLKQVSDAADQGTRDRLIEKLPFPWEGFRDQAKAWLDRLAEGRRIAVSYKPEHGKGGKLFKDSAYGLVTNKSEVEAGGNLVVRKPLEELSINEIWQIRDLGHRHLVRADLGVKLFGHDDVSVLLKRIKSANRSDDADNLNALIAELNDLYEKLRIDLAAVGAKSLREQLAAIAKARGIRAVRIYVRDKSVVAVADRRSKLPYKALKPAENHRLEIYRQQDGAWSVVPVSIFAANSEPSTRIDVAQYGGEMIMRLHKRDMVRLDIDQPRELYRVVTIEADRIRVALHTVADTSVRSNVRSIMFGGLRERNPCPVRVNLLGEIRE